MYRHLVALAFIVGCGPPPVIRMSAAAKYEVGEDATIAIEAPGADSSSPVEALLVLERPDGTKLREPATLRSERNRIKFSKPSITMVGRYRVLLVGDGKTLAAPVELNVTIDRLTEILAETIAEFKAKVRYTRAKQANDMRWKLYGGIYEHPWKSGIAIEVTIEEPGDAFKRAWSGYEEEGTLELIEGNYVRLREGSSETTARWISMGKIITLRADKLADMDPKFVGRFFARYPSDMKPK
jgi:hypothetical protein